MKKEQIINEISKIFEKNLSITQFEAFERASSIYVICQVAEDEPVNNQEQLNLKIKILEADIAFLNKKLCEREDKNRFQAACSAMQGLISSPIETGIDYHPSSISGWAVKYADALLEKLRNK